MNQYHQKQQSRKLLQNNPTKMSKNNIQNTRRTKKKNTRTTNTMDTQKHTKPKHTTQLPNHIQLKKTTSDSTATQKTLLKFLLILGFFLFDAIKILTGIPI